MNAKETTSIPFRPVRARGWRLGLANMLSRENGKWWRSRRWLFQSILWSLVLDGLLFLVLFVIPNLQTPESGPAMNEDPLRSSVQGFFSVGAIALALGIVILMQDEIVGEKQSGTAEWVLSKPLSRVAFILSKLAAHAAGSLVTMVAVPALFGYAVLWIAGGNPYPVGPFLTGAALVYLHLLFYLVLSILVGVLSESRAVILAAGLGSLLGGSFLRNFIPSLALASPWMLPDISGLAAMGEQIPALMNIPILATAGLTLLFAILALWKFRRHEFNR